MDSRYPRIVQAASCLTPVAIAALDGRRLQPEHESGTDGATAEILPFADDLPRDITSADM
jgi:hypothetical protein